MKILRIKVPETLFCGCALDIEVYYNQKKEEFVKFLARY